VGGVRIAGPTGVEIASWESVTSATGMGGDVNGGGGMSSSGDFCK
jgi:hypothetical protein